MARWSTPQPVEQRLLIPLPPVRFLSMSLRCPQLLLLLRPQRRRRRRRVAPPVVAAARSWWGQLRPPPPPFLRLPVELQLGRQAPLMPKVMLLDRPQMNFPGGSSVGGCCCCIVILVALVIVMRRKNDRDSSESSVELGSSVRDSTTKDSADIADDDMEENEYDALIGLAAPENPNANAYLKVTDLVEEEQYAKIPADMQDHAVGGEYARIPKEGFTEALCEGMDDLDPNEVMILKDRVVGKGSFGDVFRGSYRGTDIAVKMLRDGFTPEQLKTFFDEAALFARVPPHPNVVGFIGACPSPWMIITEFCGQGSLQRYIRSKSTKKLSHAQQLKVIADIAFGMKHLAANSIVHRDLAARNVLLTNDLVPKVADLGLSRQIDETSQQHQSKSSLGPVRWMSTEAIRKGVFSEASDVWAFAVTAWEVLNECSTPYGRSMKTLDVGRSVLKGLRLSYPDILEEQLELLFLQCMEADAKKRPTFTEIVEALDSAEGTEIVYADLRTFGTREVGATGSNNDLSKLRE